MPLALEVVPWVDGLAPWCWSGPGEVVMPWAEKLVPCGLTGPGPGH